MLTSRRSWVLALPFAVALAASNARAQCPQWTQGLRSEFGGDYPHALASFDGGSGSELVVGGGFTTAGDAIAKGIASWDGTRFAPLGAGIDGQVRAFTLYDDGSGTALYAGGWFSAAGGAPASNVASWDGTSWSALGSGLDGPVEALGVFAGELVVFGSFTDAGGTAAAGFATWDGTSWSVPSTGTDGFVNDLATFDDGGGAELWVGGGFTTVGGTPAANLARWDGTSWSAAGDPDDTVASLAVFDDGGGVQLYAAGQFANMGGTAASYVARWSGTVWSAANAGLTTPTRDLAVFDDGGGADLYALTGVFLPDLIRWNGSVWSTVAGGPYNISQTLTAVQIGGSARLAATGFGFATEYNYDEGVGTWDGAQWTLLGKPDGGIHGEVRSLARYDDGGGETLYAGGDFYVAGDADTYFITRWDGTGWSTVGGGMDGFFLPSVRALAVYDDGGGAELYAGGDFLGAGGMWNMNHISRWDGTSWSFAGRGTTAPVHTLHVADLGDGSLLFLGGEFSAAGTRPAERIAAWDGSAYAPLGPGVDDTVRALTTFGGALIVGGDFTLAGGAPAAHVAAWDGTAWSTLGAGVDDTVRALAVFDDGSGPALYAGGDFGLAGGAPASRIARWDGSTWSALPGTFTYTLTPRVLALTVIDEIGGQPALAVGGRFDGVGAIAADGFVTWDGAQWSNALGDTNGWVGAFSAGAAELALGGGFSVAGGIPSTNVARLDDPCAASETGPYCFGTDATCPCDNGGAADTGCDNAQSTGGVGLDVDAFAPDGSGGGTATLTGTGYPPATTPTVVAIRSTTFEHPPVVFGDGLRCVGLDDFARVGSGFAAAGVSSTPLSHGAGAGSFFYQLWYRNQPASFCDAGEAFNLSNGYELTW